MASRADGGVDHRLQGDGVDEAGQQLRLAGGGGVAAVAAALAVALAAADAGPPAAGVDGWCQGRGLGCRTYA